MHYQHRSGLQSRTKQSDHTRWESELPREGVGGIVMIALLLIVVGLVVFA